MSKQLFKKKAIYLKWKADDPLLDFPYPPIYQDKQTDYLCFTTNQNIHSKFWIVYYITDFQDSKIVDILSAYENSIEILPNQIQIGSLYKNNLEYNSLIDIPELSDISKLSKIPIMPFKKNNLYPTKDNNGNYLFTKNPIYSDGPYHGRPLLLTIGVPVSNQIETIERCLFHLKPLLEKLPSELLVIDTGSTDGTLEVCKKYNARIISFSWCNNMSAARNFGIYHALGDWYLSVDDDEWFENVDEILSFFQTKTYLDYESATYIQRNYNTSSGETWSDNHTIRMARITPELHFEGRIHDALIVPGKTKPYQIFSYAHHYGFIKNIPEKSKAKYIRNISSLLYDIYEYPTSLRYNYQLAQEFNAVEDYTLSYAYFIRGISIEKEEPNVYYGKNHASHLLGTLYNARNKELFPMVKLVNNLYPYMLSEKAFFSYIQASLATKLKKDPDEILTFYQNYLKFKNQFEKDPNDSFLYTSIGLEVCTNIQYLIDAHTIAFCAYLQKGEKKEALKMLKEISYQNILYHKDTFIQCFLYASDEIYQPCIDKLSPIIIELWSYQILSFLLKSLKSTKDSYKIETLKPKEIQNRQIKRLSYFLAHFNIDTLNRFFFRTKLVLDTEIQNVLCHTAMMLEIENASIQELFFYSFLLRCHFASETEENKRMNYFIKYIQLTGTFASNYYQFELLNNTEHYTIARDILSAYYIYLAINQKDNISLAVSHLKTALHIFPEGFQNEIEKLLQEITQPKQDPIIEELTILSKQIKKNARQLIETGKVAEAVQILEEMHQYMPADKEITKMLEMLKK